MDLLSQSTLEILLKYIQEKDIKNENLRLGSVSGGGDSGAFEINDDLFELLSEDQQNYLINKFDTALGWYSFNGEIYVEGSFFLAKIEEEVDVHYEIEYIGTEENQEDMQVVKSLEIELELLHFPENVLEYYLVVEDTEPIVCTLNVEHADLRVIDDDYMEKKQEELKEKIEKINKDISVAYSSIDTELEHIKDNTYRITMDLLDSTKSEEYNSIEF